MSIGEVLRTTMTYLLTFGLGAVSGFFLTYFHEKAKNLATREDIGKITEEIESVRQDIIHQNNLVLEEVKGRHQLRLAALDRRLQAHQEAFTLWRKLLSKVHSDDVADAAMECQVWWNENCIYLDSEARIAFRTAYHAAFNLKDFLADKRSNLKLIEENMKRIKDAGEAIVRGAELPSLGEKESEIL